MPERSTPEARRAVLPLLALLALAAPGCTGDEPPTESGISYQAVGGDWAYTASEVRLAGTDGEAPCQITGLVLHIEQLSYKGARVGTLRGRTTGGTLTCGGNLSGFGGPVASYALGNAHTVNENIGFDIGTPDWRHDAVVDASADTMSGNFVLRNGALQLTGRFAARRTRR